MKFISLHQQWKISLHAHSFLHTYAWSCKHQVICSVSRLTSSAAGRRCHTDGIQIILSDVWLWLLVDSSFQSQFHLQIGICVCFWLKTQPPSLHYSILWKAAPLNNTSQISTVSSKHCSTVSVMTPFNQYFAKRCSMVLVSQFTSFKDKETNSTLFGQPRRSCCSMR